MLDTHDSYNGIPIVYTRSLAKGKWEFMQKILVVGEGTDLNELKETFRKFDHIFLQQCGITIENIFNLPENQETE